MWTVCESKIINIFVWSGSFFFFFCLFGPIAIQGCEAWPARCCRSRRWTFSNFGNEKMGPSIKLQLKSNAVLPPRSLVAVSVIIMTAVKVKTGIHFARKHCGVWSRKNGWTPMDGRNVSLFNQGKKRRDAETVRKWEAAAAWQRSWLRYEALRLPFYWYTDWPWHFNKDTTHWSGRLCNPAKNESTIWSGSPIVKSEV